MNEAYDLVVVGGGIMGCTAALQAAAGGMRVALIEKSELGSGASGVNAGTLSLQIKRVKLMPYALKGYAWWRAAGEHVGFKLTGGYTLAFTEREAEFLTERMTLKREAGAPIEFVSPQQVLAAEPGLSPCIVAASYCADDGHANSSLTGAYLRALLREAGVTIREHAPVTAIDEDAKGYRLALSDDVFHARRLLVAAGAWTQNILAMLGLEAQIRVRVNTVSVTERAPALLHAVIGHATGLLTMKQKANGTVLIGGGWQGAGTPEDGRGHVVSETLLTNLRLAAFAVSAISKLRIVRSWTGFEANVADFYPLAGPLPGLREAYVLACVRGGYTLGPYMGRLMGDLILGRELEMPLFDPARYVRAAASMRQAS